jgi:hypothetical protein
MLAKVPSERWPSIRDVVKSLGLKPLDPDDPVLQQIGDLVREAVRNTTPWPGMAPAPADEAHTPTSIRILPNPSDLEVGDEVALKATVLFKGGAQEPREKVSWESTDPAIVRVDPNTGQMVAVAAGSAMVTASGSGVIGTLAVDVNPQRVAQVAIEPGNVTLKAGATVQLRARMKTKRGVGLERQVSWSSSDPRTASVTSDGTVTAKQSGTVSILAHCEGVGAATVLTVVAPEQEVVETADAAPRVPAPAPSKRGQREPRAQRQPRTRVATYALRAGLPVAALVAVLLTWAVLSPNSPQEISFADFSGLLQRGEVVSVQVGEGVMEVDVRSAATGSGRFQVSLAGVGVQSVLGPVYDRAIPVVGSGEGVVRLRGVSAESGQALPEDALTLASSERGGCDPCTLDAALPSGWYRIRFDENAWSVGSIQMSVPGGPYAGETLAPTSGGRVFVPGGATLELTASLSSTALALGPGDDTLVGDSTATAGESPPPPPARPVGSAVRVFGKERLPVESEILVDGTVNRTVWANSLISVIPGRTYVITARAPGHVPDTFRVTNVQTGDTLSWTPSLTPLQAPPPPVVRRPDSFESPQGAIEAFLDALRAAGLDGIQQVWSGASEGQLQPWREFLQGRRVQSATLGGFPNPTGDNSAREYWPVNVRFTYESTTGGAAPSPGVRRLRVAVFMDAGRWKLRSVTLQ